jgi:phage shock protein PspC (stress-responsive transcriptional regulator)
MNRKNSHSNTQNPMLPRSRKFQLARKGRMIAGVARGFSNITGAPIVAVRIALLLALVLGFPITLAAYLGLWILVPRAPKAKKQQSRQSVAPELESDSSEAATH